MQVVGDIVAEPTETFQVDLGTPLSAILAKSRGVGTILDNDGPNNPGVSVLTVVSDGATGATSGHNRLQWVNPAGGSPIEMRIRYNKGIPCTLPSGPDDVTSFGPHLLAPGGAPGAVESYDHLNLDLDTTYCYTVWVIHSGPVASPGVSGERPAVQRDGQREVEVHHQHRHDRGRSPHGLVRRGVRGRQLG